jgi:hypothetical protein
MTTSLPENARAAHPTRPGEAAPACGRRLALAAAQLAIVAVFATPLEAAAKYGSPVVASVAFASGHDAFRTSLRTQHAAGRPSALRAEDVHADAPRTADTGERVPTAGFVLQSDLSPGIVHARTRPLQDRAIAWSDSGPPDRRDHVAATGTKRSAEAQEAIVQAHRLRGSPPTRLD